MSDIITIIDYGMGNLNSISNMLKYLNISSIITDQPEKIRHAKKLILPGIGAFDSAVNNLKERHLWDCVNQMVSDHQIPILGICLGMQLMTKSSEEGQQLGFGWVNAETKKLIPSKYNKIPHIGWNAVTPLRFKNYFINYHDEIKFYFVHSYYTDCFEPEDVIATTQYNHSFACAFQKNNMMGVQFHPEKSHLYGMAFLKHFYEHFR